MLKQMDVANSHAATAAWMMTGLQIVRGIQVEINWDDVPPEIGPGAAASGDKEDYQSDL